MNITKEYLDRNPILYKYVLLPHRGYGWMWDCKESAEHTGYTFFMWNDAVYWAKSGKAVTLEELQAGWQ